eukprot:Blabericola_migrator_1__8194@NODE_4238_length_1265_cov_12_630217_g434_i2_p1_GENE_NODE_4238_length_1265_cov_12_630217_g434_i2NODE_4238_length_1265_cov_12_630217_g434_i2_p1_ORF_typecomplete_len131_score13_23GntR/PF00392_21/2_2e03GntR/PF00392_21/0_49_NODE_4238_length_1265_cov_12_630217_g434_i2219611
MRKWGIQLGCGNVKTRLKTRDLHAEERSTEKSLVAINRKECPTEGKNPSDQCVSREALVEAFTEAEKRGFVKLRKHYGHPIDHSGGPSNMTSPTTKSSEALAAYVLGVAGAILSTKRVWECTFLIFSSRV